MKKILLFILAFVSMLAVTGCGNKNKLKVIDVNLNDDEAYAFAISKDNNELLNSANELINELKTSGELDTLFASYLDHTSTFTYNNPVSKDNCLIVATNAEFAPFEYKKGDAFTGIDMELAYKLAQKVGKTLYIEDMNFDSVVASVQQKTCDIGMAGLSVTDERKEMVNFTNDYYKSAQVLVVNEDNNEFDGKTNEEIIEILKNKDKNYKIGAQNGTTGYFFSVGEEDLGFSGFENLTTSGYTNGILACMDLKNGKINAVIIDKDTAKDIVSSLNSKK